MTFDLRGKRVFLAGHRGMVGSALVRRLGGENCQTQIVGREIADLRNQDAVFRWFAC
jgi:GDP-L-fucose synthase